MTPSHSAPSSEVLRPDPLRVAETLRAPDLGPRILFFSGGTALRETSQALVAYTHNSVHLVTPFDSGGSSAALRRRFDMPAVGDLRSRLMALADRTRKGFPEIAALFAFRLPKNAGSEDLRAELDALTAGRHPLMADIPDPTRGVIRHHLQVFSREAGHDFDLRGACVGNLVIAAGYLENSRCMGPTVSLFSDLVKARGEVRLIVDSSLQLRARLADGVHVVGQHLITGKEHPRLTQPIDELSLVDPAAEDAPVRPPIQPEIRDAIRGADLICYPLGSFYSSLIANLLPAGVGTAVSRTSCPKVFIPNTLRDPEAVGLSLSDQVRMLLRHLRADGPGAINAANVLDAVLLDPAIRYPGSEDPERELAALGVRVIATPLANRGSKAVDPQLLCMALVSLT